jgi:hypothetical protein
MAMLVAQNIERTAILRLMHCEMVRIGRGIIQDKHIPPKFVWVDEENHVKPIKITGFRAEI